MSQVPQHLIEEATRRGIVPGAQALSADGGRPMTVAPIEEWKQGSAGSIYNGRFLRGSRLFHALGDAWAAVITPEPQAIGLQEGDAVECGPAMRAAIIELARQLGLLADIYSGTFPHLTYDERGIFGCSREAVRADRWITPEAFIAKMRVTASQPKPIKIGDHTVKFTKGEIKVGSTMISNETVRAIAAKLIT